MREGYRNIDWCGEKKREKENRVSRINRYITVERKDVISLKVTRLTPVYKDFGQTWSIFFVHVHCIGISDSILITLLGDRLILELKKKRSYNNEISPPLPTTSFHHPKKKPCKDGLVPDKRFLHVHCDTINLYFGPILQYRVPERIPKILLSAEENGELGCWSILEGSRGYPKEGDSGVQEPLHWRTVQTRWRRWSRWGGFGRHRNQRWATLHINPRGLICLICIYI